MNKNKNLILNIKILFFEYLFVVVLTIIIILFSAQKTSWIYIFVKTGSLNYSTKKQIYVVLYKIHNLH